MASPTERNMSHSSSRVIRSHIEDSVCMWFNTNLDEKDKSQLEKLMPKIEMFDNLDQLIEFTNRLADEKLFLIITGLLNKDVIEVINDSSRMRCIYTFDSTERNDLSSIKQLKNFKGSFNDVDKLCETVKTDILHYENNIVKFNCLSREFNVNSISKNKQEPDFMYAQLFNQIITSVDYTEFDFQEMIEFLRHEYLNSKVELRDIDEFQLKYQSTSSILWYTRESIFYKIINKALREQNIHIIYAMRVFIKDLHQQIVMLNKEKQFSSQLKLYRGQQISREQFQEIKNTIGGLISFTSFLSTSKNKDLALIFAGSASAVEIHVLFEITMDPTSNMSVSFANITSYSHFGFGEEEYLFSVNSIFRVEKIVQDGNGLLRVYLSSTSEHDQQLTCLTNYIHKEYLSDPPLLCDIASVLFKKGKHQEAKEIAEKILLVDNRPHVQINIYNKLGLYARRSNKLSEALRFYEKSIEMCRKCGKTDGSPMGIINGNIAMVYKEMKDYQSARSYYKKALEYYNQESTPNYDSIALVENNIATAYYEEKRYTESFQHHFKSLELRIKHLPSTHPDIAQSLNNIGMLFQELKENKDAFFCYLLSLEIKERSMHVYDPSKVNTLVNISELFISEQKFDQARKYLEDAVKIAVNSLGPNHKDTQLYEMRLKDLNKRKP